jgi:hypothetical protein
MDFSGLGGIAIAIISGLLLFTFVPGWASGENVENSQVVRTKIEAQNRLTRLTNTSRLASLISLASFAASVVVLAVAVTNWLVWFALVVTVPILLSATWLAITAARAAEKLRTTKPRKSNKRLSFENQQIIEKVPTKALNQRAWIPTMLPSPLSNRVGELRQVAPVVSFESAKADSLIEIAQAAEESSNAKPDIDVLEILKRRRVI